MSQSTSKNPPQMIAGSMIPVTGEVIARIFRADGSIEEHVCANIVTRMGLNRLAARALTGTGSAAAYVGVGTLTAAASLDSTNFGEVANGRKIAALSVQSREWFALTATYGGASDSLTGIALGAASILDHASSGQGGVWNIVHSLDTTLQGSDVLNLTARIRVGSHNLSHST